MEQQRLSNIYIPVVCALQDLISARGLCSNGRGRDNARAEGECIIRSRPLLHRPSALNPVMHTQLVFKQFSATHLPKTAVGL